MRSVESLLIRCTVRTSVIAADTATIVAIRERKKPASR
jgi:hypothetical protein